MEDAHWHLDRRVPIALIFVIVSQTVAFIWFLSQFAASVELNTQAIQRLVQQTDRQDERVRGNINSITRQDETMKSIDRTLERIEKSLDSREEQPD